MSIIIFVILSFKSFLNYLRKPLNYREYLLKTDRRYSAMPTEWAWAWAAAGAVIRVNFFNVIQSFKSCLNDLRKS